FTAAAALLVLSALGLLHLRRSPTDATVHVPGWHPEAAAA
ncbi:MAG: hypothetical protein JWN17_2361, partial [Frankiales bacterium]|nr:hypothetical protein [Frankiales bacterium]